MTDVRCIRPLRWLGVFLFALGGASAFAASDYLTQRFDRGRTGWNPNETALNSSNVSAATFGRLWSRTVDGQLYAQPLYISGLDLPNRSPADVVFAATEHNSIYAFDVNSAPSAAPLWKTSLGPSVPESVIGCGDIDGSEYGITSTPVIDREAGILYAVGKTRSGSRQFYQIHALDLRTGQERPGWPVEIAGSVPGEGGGSVNGRITFNPAIQHQRPGLLLLNGRVWIGFGSHCDFNLEFYHGWVFGLSATDPTAPQKVYCTSPDPGTYIPSGSSLALEGGGVWQGGIGLAADDAGFIYFMTGNGPLNTATGGRNAGDAYVRLHPQEDAAAYSGWTADLHRVGLSNADLKGKPQWRLLASGATGSTTLRAHLTDYAASTYDDSSMDPYTSVAWGSYPPMPVSDTVPSKGQPGYVPGNTDYLLRLKLDLSKDLAPPDPALARLTLEGFVTSDTISGIYLNGPKIPGTITPNDYSTLEIPAGQLRFGEVNTLLIAARRDSSSVGFSRAPEIRIITSHRADVPAGGFFNGNPDDLYAPPTAAADEASDRDLGSGGAVVLPDRPGATIPRILMGAGKDGIIRLLNRDALGGVQQGGENTVSDYSLAVGGWIVFGAPAYAEGPDGAFIYSAGTGDRLRQLRVTGTMGSGGITLAYKGSKTYQFPGPSPTVSSDGHRAHTGVVWLLDTSSNTLQAYDAENVSHSLLTAALRPAGATDATGTIRKFAVPTPVGGRVFVGTSSHLLAFGLLRTPGDFDGDGRVSISDVVLALQSAVGSRPFTEAERRMSDFNFNGTIDLGDVIHILQMAEGL